MVKRRLSAEEAKIEGHASCSRRVLPLVSEPSSTDPWKLPNLMPPADVGPMIVVVKALIDENVTES